MSLSKLIKKLKYSVIILFLLLNVSCDGRSSVDDGDYGLVWDQSDWTKSKWQ